MDACAELLEALQPDIDPEQQAEQVEQQLVLAECMRREGMDEFPDPDPVRGFTLRDMTFDPFDSDFQAAFIVCAAELGFEPEDCEVLHRIVLHHLLDMTLEQVARTLGVRQGTVNSRLSRGMDAMRRAMGADFESEPRADSRRGSVS